MILYRVKTLWLKLASSPPDFEQKNHDSDSGDFRSEKIDTYFFLNIGKEAFFTI